MVPLWAVAAVLWSGVAAVAVARAAGLATVPLVTTLGIIFTSIVIEALPFVLVGALVSGAIAAWVPARGFESLARLPRAVQLPVATLAGLAFPVCECGSVPVGRRLLTKGLDQGAAVAFMLAAPILNPLVLASTWVAYSGRGQALEMTAARAGLGMVIAMTIGVVVSRIAATRPVLRDRPADPHEHDHAAHGGRLAAFGDHAVADLLFMGKFLVLGAAVSAVIQAVLPQEVLSGIGGTPVLSALTMIGLAFALSLCSEADAFVALSFTAFPLGSQLAFLVAGPMLDTKLAVLYGASFKRWFVPVVVAVVVPVALVGSLLFGVVT